MISTVRQISCKCKPGKMFFNEDDNINFNSWKRKRAPTFTS